MGRHIGQLDAIFFSLFDFLANLDFANPPTGGFLLGDSQT